MICTRAKMYATWDILTLDAHPAGHGESLVQVFRLCLQGPKDGILVQAQSCLPKPHEGPQAWSELTFGVDTGMHTWHAQVCS